MTIFWIAAVVYTVVYLVLSVLLFLRIFVEGNEAGVGNSTIWEFFTARAVLFCGPLLWPFWLLLLVLKLAGVVPFLMLTGRKPREPEPEEKKEGNFRKPRDTKPGEKT